MKTILEGLTLIVALFMELTCLTSPWAQADEPSFPVKALRNEFVCPGIHAQWMDDRTLQCLKEKPL
ncbi:hypothetical protein ACJJWD_08375 [Comamonas testosteroni]|uniref:hypothetical protein n=1 Tax=Comamonas testosteroni TaxID=285 RepID=UPI00389ABEFD